MMPLSMTMFIALRVVDVVGREYIAVPLDINQMRPTMKQVTMKFVQRGRVKLAMPSGTIDGFTVALVVPHTKCPISAAQTAWGESAR